MIDEISQARARKVVKHNELIQCIKLHKFELTTQQQKIISYILSLIDEKDVETNPDHIYKFDRNLFCKVCGIDYKSGSNIQHIKQSINGLFEHYFWVKIGKGELRFQWLSAPYIEESQIEVEIPKRIFPLLCGLKKNFTNYELWQVLPLKSSYSIALYELLKSYAYREEFTIDLYELKKQLGIITEQNEELIKKGKEKEKYSDFRDFGKRVLKVSTEEINKMTDLKVSWEGIREGRSIKKIRFTIYPKDTLEVYESYKNAKEALDG